MTKVVVVSAYYNRCHLLAQTIESVLNQTHQDFELMVINDGSTDDTARELATYEDPRIRKINQNNMGFVRSIVDAIDNSQSEYIAILGSGDVAAPTRLEKQAAYLDAHPNVGVVGSYVERLSEDGQHTHIVKPDLGDDPRTTLMAHNLFNHTDVMIRRSFYKKAGGYRTSFTFSQDYDLWLRMSEICDLALIKEPLVRSQVLADSVTGRPNEKRLITRSMRIYATHCARERRAGRQDPIDKYGPVAFLLRPRSRNLAVWWADDAIKAISLGDIAFARKAAQTSWSEAPTFRGLTALALASAPNVANMVLSLRRKYLK